MLSINLESLGDDALFGSGTEAWNNQSNILSAQECLISRDTNMTAQNGDVYDASHAPIVQISSIPITNSGPREARGDQITVAARASSGETGEQVSNREPVVRPKEIRNGERKNSVKLSSSKNVSTSSNSRVPNRSDSVPLRSVMSMASANAQPGWEPTLRTVRYDNDLGHQTVEKENKQKKVANSSKRRKDDANMKINQNKQSVGDPNNRVSSNLHLPQGLNVNSNMNNSNKIYLKHPSPSVSAGQISNIKYVSNGNKTDNNAHSTDRSVKVSESQNLVQYKNTWVEKPKNMVKPPEKPSNGSVVNTSQNDLEMDSEQPTCSNTTFLRLAAPTVLPRTPSGSDLTSRQIVVPYEQQRQSLSDSSLQFHYPSLETLSSVSSSPISSVTTISTLTSPTDSTPVFTDCNNFLPSSLSSSALFGDGHLTTDSDYQFAQQLQLEYDRENEANLRRNGYDIAPTQTYRSRGSQSPQTNTDYSTIDYLCNEMGNLRHENAGQTSDVTSPVYIPERFREQVAINTRCQINGRSPNIQETNSDTEVDIGGSVHLLEPNIVTHLRISPTVDTNQQQPQESSNLVYIPLSQEQDELSLPEPGNIGHSSTSRDTAVPRSAVIRADISTDPEPIQSVHSRNSSNSNMVARGHGWERERTTSMEDASLARQLQEEQDEELARMLQEQESEGRYHSNHYRSPRGQPLHALIDTGASPSNWLSRPLRVGQGSGAINNNVADSRVGGQSRDRPLQVQYRRNRWSPNRSNDDYAMLDYVHDAGYDIPPSQDYYYRYEYDPDYMQDEHGEDRLISINRDPRLLASLLMTRAPNMLIPNDVDLNDYEALWELAENLGEVRRVGMEQDDISRLPVHTYQPMAAGKSDDNKTDCLVCMSEFEAGEQLRTLPCCHIYHVTCIDEWLRRNAICPICRQPAK